VYAYTAYPYLPVGVTATSKTGNAVVTYSYVKRYLFGR
jgi:hypothetical protein